MNPLSKAMASVTYTVRPETAVLEALELARRHDIHHFPVLRGDRLVGLVCTCDLDAARLSDPVSCVMHANPTTIQVDDSFEEAACKMDEDGIGSLVVLSGERVVGILTRNDLAREAPPQSERFGRCSACGSLQHLRAGRPGEPLLCADCGGRRHAPEDERELGTGD